MSIKPEEVVQVIDQVVFTKLNRHLKEVETVVLRGAWEAKTYEQMAENCQYSLTYIKQAAAPRLWKLLSDILEVSISKTNFRVVIEKKWQDLLVNFSENSSFRAENNREDGGNSLGDSPRQDWNQAPEVNIFYGRSSELDRLKKWLIQDNCRLVAVTGMGGIGKTALSVRCARELQEKFDYVIWRNLLNAPTVHELISDLIQFISQEQDHNLSADLDEQISRLLVYLREYKCLIILDTATTILQTGVFAGNYREEYQDYARLLQRLGQEFHQSCLMIIAREKPREIALMAGDTLPVRTLALKGLGSEAEEILKAKKLLDQEKWSDLIAIYRGNPLALKIVASTIKELFGGKVSTFLRQETIIFGELNDILDEQFECISEIEQEILYWLAIESQPISFSGLRSDILAPITPGKLIDALESLLRRSLIDRTIVEEEIFFSLQQPVVAQYVINQIIAKVCQEIQAVSKNQNIAKIDRLRTLALIKNSQINQEAKETQDRFILKPIINQLCIIFKDENLIEEQLTKISSLLEGKTSLVVGYAKYNLKNLLSELKSQKVNLRNLSDQ